jgi:hypothetical protein
VAVLGHYNKIPVLLAWCLQLWALDSELRRLVEQPGCDKRLLALQETIDAMRGGTLGVIWELITSVLTLIFNLLLPKDLQVYAFPLPIFRTGPGVYLGICTMVEGPRDAKPESFVCNVGHIDCRHKSWYYDIVRTGRSSFGITRDFEESNKEDIGLVSNILCVIPIGEKAFMKSIPHRVKEFNFSAWQSDKHAFDWYVNSPDHRLIMKEHSDGTLKNFGNVLTALKPTKPIRWQARCSECAAIVEGYPEVKECECGAKVISMPLF